MKIKSNYLRPESKDHEIEQKFVWNFELQAKNRSDLFKCYFPRVFSYFIRRTCYTANNQIKISLMNPLQIPYFFLYCANQEYTIFHPYAYPVVVPEKNVDLLGQNQIKYDPESRNKVAKLVKQQDGSWPRKIEDKQLARKKQKKFQSIKKQEKDVEFKQRQQTTNRNLCSNTLKIFFKQLRDKNSETFLNINKIIEANQIAISREFFLEKMDQLFPTASTYISFENVKKVCNHPVQFSQDYFIAKVLRTSMTRFYAYQIYAVNIKSIRTTRKIRNQQIKQGKTFLRELSL